VTFFAYETMLGQCSTEDWEVLLMITQTVGDICDSSRQK